MPDGAIQTDTSPMIDSFGRKVTYLRMSVTDRCDLRCSYCMAERMTFLPKQELLSLEELETVARAFVDRGVRKIRITGGEPLVRKDIGLLFERLGKMLGEGLDELTLTTNATLLDKFAGHLFACGVRRVNISLDTIDPERFREITRLGNLDQVLRGIAAAKKAGLKVKINAVALKHQNVDGLPDLIEWAHRQGHDVTLIEVMPLGETGEDRFDQYIPLPELKDRYAARWGLEDIPNPDQNSGPSRYVRVKETGGKLGFITPLTNNFCAGCNRMRVTCTGRIYMCLGQEDSVDLRAALRQSDIPRLALSDALDRALLGKPEKHEFEIKSAGEHSHLSRHMSVTGG